MANYFLNDDGSLTKKNKKKKGNNYILQDDGTITLNSSDKEDIAPIKEETTKKYYNSLGEEITLEKKQLMDRRDELQDQLRDYKREEKVKWWDSDKGFLKNSGNVLYKLFAENQETKYVEDENYDKLLRDYKQTVKSIEDYNIENKKYEDGFMGFVEKSGDTIVGNVKTAEKGMMTTTKKLLGQELTEEDYEQHYYERLGQKAVQESSGVEKIVLDVEGSVARMIPQMAVGGASKLAQVGATALGFANYGGGAYNQARQDGYSDEQATAYGIAIGGMEMALTKALGSFSNVYGKTKVGNFSQGIIDKTIPKIIANKQVREVMAQFGSEATEEFLQEYIDGIAKDTLLDGEGLLKSTWKNITDPDKFSDALYSALIGGITGSAMATPTAIDNYRYEKTTGRDAETRLTANEQTVLDTVKEQRTTEIQKERTLNTEIDKEIKEFEATFGKMTEAEKKGIRERIQEKLDNGEIDYSTSKLSKKEIAKIEQEVRADLEKGYIDIDTIENTLAGEKVAQIKELEARLNETTNEQEKAEIQAQINELANAKNTELQGMLGKDLYLQRSYREANLQKEKFFYEPTGYESEYKRSLAKDFEKVANNTTKSHETFEMLSKIAEDKQTNYGVINNEQLKQLGYDVEGKDVNGLVRVNEDGTQKVLINIDSNKAINRIIGHETTHLLEGTKEYTELQQMVKEYAETKGDYSRLHKELTKLYDGIDADIEAEVTSELVGDYLFTDTGFINSLSTQKPTIFQKIYNEIKHLYKLATAGSKEARQLEKVKKAFDKAYKQNASNTSETDTKYSISDNKGKTLYTGSSNTNIQQFKVGGIDGSKQTGDRYGRGVYLTTNKDTAKGYAGDKGKVYEINTDDLNIFNLNDTITNEMKEALLNELNSADKQYRNSILRNIKSEKTFTDFDGANAFMKEQRAIWKEQDGYYDANKPDIKDINYDTKESTIEYTDFNNLENLISNLTGNQLYDALKSISTDDFSSFITGNGYDGISFDEDADNQQYVIYRNEDKLNILNKDNVQYSLTDNKGRTLTKGQQEYFKDSKVRDENGNLLTVYHGTGETFTKFEKEMIGSNFYQDSQGFFFTDDIKQAEDYANTTSYGMPRKNPGNVMETYLNITNPLIENIDFDPISHWDENYERLIEKANKNGNDGVIIKAQKYQSMYVAFEPNQIKNVDNTNPTTDEDIRYSLSKTTDNQGRTLTKEQQEYFKDSKATDENGNLKVLYHGTPNEFNKFSYEFLGTNGTLLGKGFYLTDDTNVAKAYANKGEQGKVMELYADIKKPLKWGETTISKQQFQRFVEAVNQATEGRLFADYSGEFSEKGSKQYNSTLNDILMDYEYGGDDIDLISGILNSTGMSWDKGYKILKDTTGYDGIIVTTDVYDSGEGNVYIPFQSSQIKNVDNTNPTESDDIRYSLGNQDVAPSRNDIFGSDIKLQVEEAIAPIREEITELKEVLDPDYESRVDYSPLTEEDIPYLEQQYEEDFKHIDESNIPMEQEDTTPEVEEEVTTTRSLEDVRDFDEIGSRKIKAYQYENPEVRPYFQEMATYMLGDLENSVKGERNFNDQLYYDTAGEQGFYGTTRQTTDDIAELLDSKYNYTYKDIRKGLEAIIEDHGAENIAVAKRIELALDKRLREGYTDVTGYEIPANQEYLKLLQEKEIIDYYNNLPIDESMIPVENVENYVENVSNTQKTGEIASIEDEIIAPVQRQFDLENQVITDKSVSDLEKKQQRAYKKLGSKEDYISNKAYELYDEVKNLKKGVKASYELGRVLDVAFANVNALTEGMTETRAKEVRDKIWRDVTTSLLNVKAKPMSTVNKGSTIEAVIRQNIGREYDSKKNDIANMKEEDLVTKTKKELRKELLIDESDFFINALDNAKNRSMALMNNTDTIRNTELVFGRENGRKINEIIFQKEIDNEADSIAWQNKERQEIKDLGIKARSKESAAVQKYGEKQYVNDAGEVVAYGDKELAKEFSDVATQKKIKKAAQVIRNKYDNYIDAANNVLTKLGFDPIPKRNDYMRHFQELNDVFSRYGIPFNAQSMSEHVLPTDINGLTENWSPQKNYFANMQARKGLKTTYDAITGVDGYIGGIANLIYHTEDIQRGRAFEELIRETYGEDKGFENLENLPEELQQARIEKIQDNHLSNYAAWVHEWTNNVAGKKSKIDRSVESMFGRKAFSFLDNARKQVGSNMIGFNLSSSLTNLIAPVQATAKTNKLAVLKGTADTIKNMFVKDDFMSKNKFLTSRMGADMISKNAWQKIQDAGFVFMKGMDWFSSNQIVRSKFYELRAKGMSEAEAHAEAGKFAARILGDRTKGANAQLYNSKLIGLVTQFQLEVNNQLYSTFYDTYHESKENAQNDALKTAAGMTFTLGQLFAFTHIFGQTFEAIAGYNPTMDAIEILKTALGWGEDDDEEEKTTSERLKDAADQLVDALPYVNILTGGGRIPVASGLPNLVGVATGGKDQYGNELTLEDELKKLLFLIPPTGGNQFKKTTQGLGMFDEDLPISGSYTDSGNLRFPVEDTIQNRIQASLFGQYANENASYYFDNELAPLKEKQIEEFIEMDIPYKEYREYRKELSDVNKTTADKDENGKAISGTAAGKKAYKIMNGDYSKKEKERLLEGLSSETYRITTSDLNKLNNNEDLYKYYFSLSTKGKSDFINAINNYGFNAETLYEANVTLKNIEDNYSKLNDNGNNLSKQKKQAIKNAISQYTTTNAQYNYLYHKYYKK